MKSSVSWDISDVSGEYVASILGSKKKAGKKLASRACYLAHASLFFDLFFEPEIEATCFSEMMVEFKGPHGIISQKTELFITAVRTSNPTEC
jgi:hypothetical protein